MNNNNNNINEQYKEFKKVYRYRPIAFFRNVLKFEPSLQQRRILVKAVKPDARVAVKSATGTGKTFLAAGFSLHQLLCEDSIKILCTAPSAGQLSRGMIAEIVHLHRCLPKFLGDLLTVQTEKVFVKSLPDNFCSFVSTDTKNKESLAGLHAKKVVIINDEASAITDDAYDTLLGNLTTNGSSMLQISNPVRPDGKFRNLWKNKKMEKIWHLFTLDAFGSPFISQKWIDHVKLEYGEDSDMYRMRVLGEFPRVAEDIFFDADIVDESMIGTKNVRVPSYAGSKKIMGIDVARFGSDQTVFCTRQGGIITDLVTYNHLDTEQVAMEAVDYYNLHDIDVICVDGIGLGAGVVDKLKHLGLPVIDVVVSEAATDPKTYYNMRSQLYGEFRQWLNNGGKLPNNQSLADQLMTIRYGYNKKMQLQIVSKLDLKRRYKVPSPDMVDAITLTFYEAWANFLVPGAGENNTPLPEEDSGYEW